MKTGHQLSTDYGRLWDLIQDGYRIPAWITNRHGTQDLVEVKLIFGFYEIGTRGQSYSGFDKTKEGFVSVCEIYGLQYVVPSTYEDALKKMGQLGIEGSKAGEIADYP